MCVSLLCELKKFSTAERSLAHFCVLVSYVSFATCYPLFTLLVTVLVVHILVSGSKCKFPVLKVFNTYYQ